MLKTDYCAGHQVIQSSGNGYHQSMPPAKNRLYTRFKCRLFFMAVFSQGGFSE